MSNITVLGFESQDGAEGMLENLNLWQDEGLVEIIDAVVASRGKGGEWVDIKQTHSEKGKFARRGSGVGLLAGLLLGGPILGLAGGAAIGAITGSMKDYGIDDKFIKEASKWVGANRSALFVMTDKGNAEELLERLKPFKAIVLSTTLEPEQETALQKTLEEEKYD